MNLREKFIALVDNDYVKKSDAIILLEGDGLNRYNKAAELYQLGRASTLVFSGGITNYNYGSFPFSDISPKLIESGIPPNAILHEDKSQNTREQAIEVIKIAKNNKWNKLILIASHYHQYRAYLTFLCEILNSEQKIILYNAPAKELKWFEETGWGTRFDLLSAEFERIEKYTKLLHLASYNDAIEYQKWKELQE